MLVREWLKVVLVFSFLFFLIKVLVIWLVWLSVLKRERERWQRRCGKPPRYGEWIYRDGRQCANAPSPTGADCGRPT